MVKGQKITRF